MNGTAVIFPSLPGTKPVPLIEILLYNHQIPDYTIHKIKERRASNEYSKRYGILRFQFDIEVNGLIDQSKIRNFSIIAHIDHGKSTLADRLLEHCNAVSARDMENQLLDNMELERERGITIKARAVKLEYTASDGETYSLNLIDTPGHVDFNYEVSRSLAACEGAVLVVDASQGIEAQTLANTYLAIEHDLEVLPVLNKIDLPSADPVRVKEEIERVIGIPAMDAPEISAKNGINIGSVLEDVVKNIPAPKGDPKAPLQALIFDSQYDSYRGVIVYLRVINGVIRPDMDIRMMFSGAEYKVVETGFLRPIGMEPTQSLSAGQVGYFTASIKNVKDTQVGDTVTDASRPAAEALPGYRKVQPMVFSGIYTIDGAKYPDLRDALEKLKLNDASLSFEPESSAALGFGFRCGFLGLLHMEIIQERLDREYNLDLITTAPSVIYRVTKTSGEVLMIDNPLNYPNPSEIELAEEPFVAATILTPSEYVGNIMDLCQDRRGEYKNMSYLDEDRVELHYELPLNEIIYDFFDALKSRTRGYASLDYEFLEYRPSDLVKLDILLNGEIVDALSFIVHTDKAYPRGRKIAEKLKENIPRQLFEVPVQAAVGGKIIARETIKAVRKDVLAKCYGGDITRKKKLLEKQKEGKKRMRNLGSVSVPQEAFMAVLKLDE
jgi:GTP-binding protein LepA